MAGNVQLSVRMSTSSSLRLKVANLTHTHNAIYETLRYTRHSPEAETFSGERKYTEGTGSGTVAGMLLVAV